MVMNGGVHHAMDVLSPTELEAAASGFRFLSLEGVADLLEDAQHLDEDEANRRYWDAVPDDEVLQNPFAWPIGRLQAPLRRSPAKSS
jgi:hypothetical protein